MRHSPTDFGGKSKIANIVWDALGQPHHYLEPFFGSGAVLLARPAYDPSRHVETVCDADGHLANVWRSLQFSPEEVARWCDWPVNHADLAARKAVLLKHEGRLLEHLTADASWHDPLLAGYWIWAASCWIGAGLTSPGQIPHLGDGGRGMHKLTQRAPLGQIPHFATKGTGVHSLGKRPHLTDGGMGVHKLSRRSPTYAEQSVQEPYNPGLYAYFRQLSERLRYVRVACGDWTRICGGRWQAKLGSVGIFFDPPYGVVDRDPSIYHHDSSQIAHAVRVWALERGMWPDYRIVLAGYDEHDSLLAHGWTVQRWTAGGGYANLGKGRGQENRRRETLYCSPGCVGQTLFDAL